MPSRSPYLSDPGALTSDRQRSEAGLQAVDSRTWGRTWGLCTDGEQLHLPAGSTGSPLVMSHLGNAGMNWLLTGTQRDTFAQRSPNSWTKALPGSCS